MTSSRLAWEIFSNLVLPSLIHTRAVLRTADNTDDDEQCCCDPRHIRPRGDCVCPLITGSNQLLTNHQTDKSVWLSGGAKSGFCSTPTARCQKRSLCALNDLFARFQNSSNVFDYLFDWCKRGCKRFHVCVCGNLKDFCCSKGRTIDGNQEFLVSPPFYIDSETA